MAFTIASEHLYYCGAPESYFDGVPEDAIALNLLASLGECSRKLSPRAGGPASSWTFSDPAGEAECRRDVAIVAASAISLAFGLTLPGEGADPKYEVRAESVRSLWSRMGAPGDKSPSKAEPLYAGLVDATPTVVEGAARGYSAVVAVNDFSAGEL